MTLLLAFASGALALAWIPIALRFKQGWRDRQNPVSLAICAAVLLFSYQNVLVGLALANETTWRFVTIASHIFEVIVVVNFYFAFRWSDTKFADARRGHTIEPVNTTRTPRQA